ncbi:MAG: carbohydrate kinase family protein [Phycisphaeraceae bacterium]
MSEKTIDCVVCGSCVIDMLVRPVPLDVAIGGGVLVPVEPITLATGGIVSNSGSAMAKLGMRAAAFSYVGDDDWAALIRRRYEAQNLDATRLLTHPTASTSTTAVLIDPTGERTFAHCVGAPKLMNVATYMDNLDLFARSRMMLLGYYSLMPNLEQDLPEIFAAVRERGCRTALDAAGDGGSMQPLDRILPHLDVYVPSQKEAEHQTGESDPRHILRAFRSCGASGVVGVKLGSDGALLSDRPGEYVEVAAVKPPGDLLDTTGAGDSFYAGLLTGLLRGMPLDEAGRLAAATGACCITGVGATAGLRCYNDTATLAGLEV